MRFGHVRPFLRSIGTHNVVDGDFRDLEISEPFGSLDPGHHSKQVALIGVRVHDATLMVLGEACTTHRTAQACVHEAIAHCGREPSHITTEEAAWSVPPGHKRSLAEWMHLDGFEMVQSKLGPNDGVVVIRSMLEAGDTGPELLIHARCTGLLAAVRDVQYRRAKNERLFRMDNLRSHWIDALRYLVAFHLGGVRFPDGTCSGSPPRQIPSEPITENAV